MGSPTGFGPAHDQFMLVLVLLFVLPLLYARRLRALNRQKRGDILTSLNRPQNTRIVAFFHPYWYVPGLCAALLLILRRSIK